MNNVFAFAFAFDFAFWFWLASHLLLFQMWQNNLILPLLLFMTEESDFAFDFAFDLCTKYKLGKKIQTTKNKKKDMF